MTGDQINIKQMNDSNFVNGNVFGNVTSTSYANIQKQEIAKEAIEIQQLLAQLENEGNSLELAQQKAANKLVTKAQGNSIFKENLRKWSHYLGDAAANGLIEEAAVTVVKLALPLLGIPIP